MRQPDENFFVYALMILGPYDFDHEPRHRAATREQLEYMHQYKKLAADSEVHPYTFHAYYEYWHKLLKESKRDRGTQYTAA